MAPMLSFTSAVLYPCSSSLFNGSYSRLQNHCSVHPSASSKSVFKCFFTLTRRKEENSETCRGAVRCALE